MQVTFSITRFFLILTTTTSSIHCAPDEENFRTGARGKMVNVGLSVGNPDGLALAGISISSFTGALACTGPQVVEEPITQSTTQVFAGATGCKIKLFTFVADGETFQPIASDPFTTFDQNDSATFQNGDGSIRLVVKVGSVQLPSPLSTSATVVYRVQNAQESNGNVNVSTPSLSTVSAVISFSGEVAPTIRLRSVIPSAFNAVTPGLTFVFECDRAVIGSSMSATCNGDALNTFRIGVGLKPWPVNLASLKSIVNGARSFLTSETDVIFVKSAEAPNGGFKITRSLSSWGLATYDDLATDRLAVSAKSAGDPTAFAYTEFKNATFSWSLNNSITVGNLVTGACAGNKYVRSTTHSGLFVGVILCDPAPTDKIKIILASSATGPFREIGDYSGHGQDHCELVNPNFTLPNSDDITSGCPTCEDGPSSVVKEAPYYLRNSLGTAFSLVNVPPSGGHLTMAFQKCGVAIQ